MIVVFLSHANVSVKHQGIKFKRELSLTKLDSFQIQLNQVLDELGIGLEGSRLLVNLDNNGSPQLIWLQSDAPMKTDQFFYLFEEFIELLDFYSED